MQELIDRIENKIAEFIQTNEQLREKIRLLSSERDQWVQECSLHEQERQNLNERLEKLLSALQEAGKEIALSQAQQIKSLDHDKEDLELSEDEEKEEQHHRHHHYGQI